MHYIYQFSRENGEGEFIVISDLPRAEVLDEWSEGVMFEYRLDNVYTIDEDAISLPCDCQLEHSLS